MGGGGNPLKITHPIVRITNRRCVAEWLGCWTYIQQVVGSNSDLSAVDATLGKLLTHVPQLPNSIIWYHPMVDDALWLGR